MKSKHKRQSTVKFKSMVYEIMVANFRVDIFTKVVELVITSICIYSLYFSHFYIN